MDLSIVASIELIFMAASALAGARALSLAHRVTRFDRIEITTSP
jgi:hypothetical protein